MKTRLLCFALALALSVAAVGCGQKSASAGRVAKSAPVVSAKPDPSVEVAWFNVDKEYSVVRFLAPISNPGDKAIEGLVTEWIAYDDNDSIVGSFKTKQAMIPANGSLPYIGGAGGANLSGVPARVEVRIVEPGRFTSGAGTSVTVSEIKLTKDEFGPEYSVAAKATVDTEVASDGLAGYVVLKDAAGKVVGADFWSADNLPSVVPAASSFAVKAEMITVTGKPTSAEVVIVVEPAS